MKSIITADINCKDILVRVDLNVPLEKGKVSDKSRITAIMPTLNHIIKEGGRPIILSHFGRPKNSYDKSLSLGLVLTPLKEILNKEVIFCNSTDSGVIKEFLEKTPRNKVILLENTRFFDGELFNSQKLGRIFSKFGNLYCNDAFSASHRSHASLVAVTEKLPSYSGLHLEKEISALSHALFSPDKPLVAIIGGSKVSTKIKLLENLVKKVDHIIIGGGMANTFLFAQKKEVGCSLYERNSAKLALKILEDALKENCQIHLPLDAVCGSNLKETGPIEIVDINCCPKNKMILDAGPKTVTRIHNILNKSKTLIWNGPLGAFETPPFDQATTTVAKVVANLTQSKKLLSVAGGGDTVAALNLAKVANSLTYVSNAGGAFLEWMEGKSLPGLVALSTGLNA